jgi:ketosteroid isomerase-like protein
MTESNIDPTSLEARIAELEKKVALLDDIEALRRLRMTYHDYFNEGRWAEIADLFTEDASIDFEYVAMMKGREDIMEQFLDIPNNTDMLKQFIHNHVVDVNGDTAKGFLYLEAKYADHGESLFVAGKVTDDYVRVDNRWLIQDTVTHLYFTTPLSKGWAIENPHYLKGGTANRENLERARNTTEPE